MSKKIPRNFTKPTQISKHLCCAICTEVFQEPTRLACGHTYCGDCIVSWAAQGTTCPECRTEIKPELIGRDIIADKIILDLEVSCVNKLCPWKGKLEILEKHVKYCPYEKTPDWLSKLKSAFKIEDEEKSNHQLEDNDEFNERVNEEVSGKSLSERLYLKGESSQTLLQSVFEKEPNRRRESTNRIMRENDFNLLENLLSSGSKASSPSKINSDHQENEKENIFLSIIDSSSSKEKNGSEKKEGEKNFPMKRKFGNSLDNQDSKKVRLNN